MPPETVQQLAQDKELLKNMATDMFNLFKNADRTGFAERHTLDEFINATKDERKIKNYLDAQKVTSRVKQCHDLANKYRKSGLVTGTYAKGINRHIELMLDTSGTPEAEQKNIELLNKCTTVEGAQEEFNKHLQTALKFDYSKLNATTPEEKIKTYDENFKELQILYVLKSAMNNSAFNIDEDTRNFLSNKMGVIEHAGDIINDVKMMSSNMYITTPDTLTLMDTQFAQKEMFKYAVDQRNKGIPGYEIGPTSAESEPTTEAFNLGIISKENNQDYDLGYNKLVEEGIIDKDFLFTSKAPTMPGQNKEMSLDACISIYGGLVREYNKESAKDPNLTFEDYKKNLGYGNSPFEKEPSKGAEEVSKRLAKGTLVASHKDFVDFTESQITEVNNDTNIKQGTRSRNRAGTVREKIFRILENNQYTGGIKLDAKKTKLLVGQIRNVLAEKHASRSGLWKFFHPRQNKYEKETLDSIDQKLIEHGYTENEIDGLNNGYKELKDDINKYDKIVENIETAKNKNNVDMSYRSEKTLNNDKTLDQLDKANNIKVAGKENTEEVLDELDFGNKPSKTQIKTQNDLTSMLANSTCENVQTRSNQVQTNNAPVRTNTLGKN